MKKTILILLIIILLIACKLNMVFSPTYSPKRTVIIQKNIKSDTVKQKPKLKHQTKTIINN